MDRATLISILGVTPDPTTGELRHARREVATSLHPDLPTGSAAVMSDINAACDEWIAEIRRHRAMPAATPAPAELATRRTSPRAVDVLATLGTMAAVTTIVIAGVGPSAASLAFGLLAGAAAAALMLTVLYRLSD